MIDLTGRRYAVVDVEGNGQHPPDLVELAVVPIADGIIGQPTSWLIRPDRPIKPIASRIHGIRNRDVAEAPAFTAVRDEVVDALDGATLVAHNAPVDIGVLRRHLGDEWQPPDVLDTLRLARRLLPGRASYRLGALVEAYGLADALPVDTGPHRAAYDALVTARLFCRLVTTAEPAAALEDSSLF